MVGVACLDQFWPVKSDELNFSCLKGAKPCNEGQL